MPPDLALWDLGIPDAILLLNRLTTDGQGYETNDVPAGIAGQGILRLTVPAHSATTLTPATA